MRPNSSKVEAFISSWMAFGCSGSVILLALGARSVLKPKVVVSFTRTKPSQLWSVLPGALQLLLAAKFVP